MQLPQQGAALHSEGSHSLIIGGLRMHKFIADYVNVMGRPPSRRSTLLATHLQEEPLGAVVHVQDQPPTRILHACFARSI
eukprot:scaffold1954_cov268-Pinguiococcus_pyrenoidosus.AAC.58